MDTAEDEKLEPSTDRASSPHGDSCAATDVADPLVGLGSEVASLAGSCKEFDSTNSVTIVHESTHAVQAFDDAALSPNEGGTCVGTVDIGQGDENNQSPCGTVQCSDEIKDETSEISTKNREEAKEGFLNNLTPECDNSRFNEISMDNKNLDGDGNKSEYAEDSTAKVDYEKLETETGIVKMEDADEAVEKIGMKTKMGNENDCKGKQSYLGEEDYILQRREDDIKGTNRVLEEEDDVVETKEDDAKGMSSVIGEEGGIKRMSSVIGEEGGIKRMSSVIGEEGGIKRMSSVIGEEGGIKRMSSVIGEEGDIKRMSSVIGEEGDIKEGNEPYPPKVVDFECESETLLDSKLEDSEKKQDLLVDADETDEIEGESQDNDVDDEMASVGDEIDESEDKNKEAFEEVSGDMGEEKTDDMTEVEQSNHGEDGTALSEKRVSNGKRKRGKGGNKATFGTSKKRIEEDVCFICFDGGDLVLCDRRGCPKAYHPSCVNHDEAFFRTKGRWNCGWHQCSVCEKNAAYYMCFTCTFSLCKACIKESVIYCVRGNKGFCETCYKTVNMVENRGKVALEPGKVDFDDKSSWEFLFKDYWMALREKLSITSEEIELAKNPGKGSDSVVYKAEGSEEFNEANIGGASGSESSLENADATKQKKKKGKKRLKSRRASRHSQDVEWASKELLELVMHMRNGDASVCSQFDVQALLLEYITKNKLRDPRRKSQIICDFRLQNLFGKPRVGHFEMLKLLESHFLLKEEESQGDDDAEANQTEGDEALAKGSKEKKRKSRKKSDGKSSRTNADDYAAIDNHNINLIYLRRSIVENLLNDSETFQEKVVGAFVRLRIPGSSQKQDLYRLVQVVGTTKKAELYRVGKKTTDLLLEILNLNKKEIVSIDIISNQEFTEDECKRLRQSIKCGLINPLTVGAIQEKAIALQAVRVQDSLEAEITRLSHLRDRASDMGRRKELRECVEKLSVLRSHDERQRRLDELPDIHSDPKMDPNYESDDDESISDDRKNESYLKPIGGSFNRRPIEPLSPLVPPSDTWTGSKISTSFRDLARSLSSKSMYNKVDTFTTSDLASENSHAPIRDRDTQHSTWEKPKSEAKIAIPDLGPKISHEIEESQRKVPPVEKVNETEKIWHYKDPSGKIQGPFSMTQLRKWSTTGYFPSDLRIWKSGESLECSYLLTEALIGVLKVGPPVPLERSQPLKTTALSVAGSGSPTPVEQSDKWGAGTNLPSPTPSARKDRVHKSRWSPTPTGESTNLSAQSESKNLPLTSQVQSNVGTPSFDVKSLQNLVQHVANTPAWANTPQKTEANNPVPGPVPAPLPSVPMQPSNAYNNWGNPPIPGTYTGNNPTWRPPMPIPPNTTSWGPAPSSNPGWVPSPGWAPPMHAPGSAGWGPPIQGWSQPAQGPPPVNPGTSWMGPGSGPNQGPTGINSNPSPGWSHVPPPGTWGNDFGGRPWNRAPAPPPPPAAMNKGTRVCKFHESGHCKKGSACDYMHA